MSQSRGTMVGCTRSAPCRIPSAAPHRQLQPVAELFGAAHPRPDRRNPFDENAVAVDLGAEGDAGQDREFLRRVETLDVEARDQPRRSRALFLQRIGVGFALFDAGEDEIAGAVQDAVDARQPVAGERLAQRLDDRDAPPPDRRLEREAAPAFSGEVSQLDVHAAASIALFAVTTPFPVSGAAARSARAGPSSPPVSSTKTSMELDALV